MIKYIGSKRKLIPHILAAFSSLPQGSEILDLFSGTSRVGYALKKQGFSVTANDHNAYASCLARCYVAADLDRVEDEATTRITELQRLAPEPGWFTRIYCQEARFFHEKNGGRIEAIRKHIALWDLAPDVEAVLLVSLMEAADRVDSTTGLQMAYLKKWAPRAFKELELRLPKVLAGPGRATCLEAVEAARAFSGRAAYVDPPYNQHSYRSNYHIWETLVRWDQPEVYGVARKRIDCRTNKSAFNSKRKIAEALTEVIDALDVELMVVSFNNEGHLDREAVEEILSRRGHVRATELDYKRYVGAQIGIFSPSGDKVGKVSHLRNKELLYFVSSNARATDRVLREVRATLPPPP